MQRAVFLFSFLWCIPSLAQDDAPMRWAVAATPDAPLKVGYGPIAPFVMVDRGGYPYRPAVDTLVPTLSKAPTGYDIDIWSHVASDLGLAYEWVPIKNVADGLEKVEKGELDVAMGALSITWEREKRVDFTHPVYDAGLGIMIKPTKISYWDAWRLDIILGFLILILVAGHVIWFFERGKNFDPVYPFGVWEGIYWAIVTASTVGYGDKVAKGRAGQVVAVLVIFLSLPLFGMFIGNITSAITLQDQQSSIQSPGDIKGRVGVVRGTTSADYVARLGLKIYQAHNSNEMFEAFERGEVDAVIYDVPALKYYAQHHDNAVVVGKTFEPQHLAFIVANGSPLRERINRVLLKMQETRDLDRVKVRWFGQL